MQSALPVTPPSPYTSHLARAVSRYASPLGDLLASLVRLNDALSRNITEVKAELAALRAAERTKQARLHAKNFFAEQILAEKLQRKEPRFYQVTPEDIAWGERPTKSIHRRSKVRILSAEERAAYCAKKKADCESKREQLRLAREAEWQRELATWPKFVPRKTIKATQVVVRSAEWLKQQPTFSGLNYSPNLVKLPLLPIDNLAGAQVCTHRLKRSFTFSTGETITLCPDCGKAKGHAVLLVENIFKASDACTLFYGELLCKAGLSEYAGLNSNLSYMTPNKMIAMEHARTARLLWGGTRVKLNSWASEKDGEDSKYGDGETSISDRSVRDYRASQIRKAHEDVLPTAAVCARTRCGKSFANRKGTKHCSDTCRKMHWKEQRRANNLPQLATKGANNGN